MGEYVFHSKVDAWFYATIIFTVMLLGFVAYQIREVQTAVTYLVLGGAAVVSIGLPIWVLVSTRYVVSPEFLRIRSGPFAWKIERSSISGISMTSSIMSSPALSLDRMRVEYGHGRSILVSPIDREGFASALGLPLN